MLAYLNGRFLPRSAATVSVEDRGWVFGDGVYEVWRVVNGQLFELDRHLDRLMSGLRELRITAPEVVRRDALIATAGRLLSESGCAAGEATLYLQITRGVAPRGHQFPAATTAPTAYLTVNPLGSSAASRAQGVAAITIPDVRWLRCDIKTLQLLPNVLAKQAAVEAGAMEVVMVRDGIVTEGSHTNVMAVIDGVVRTHPADNFILPGVTRSVVLEIAHELGLPVAEERFTEEEMARASELFFLGTTSDVMPVVRVNDRIVGDGAPGPIGRQLYAALRARLDAAGASGTSDADHRTIGQSFDSRDACTSDAGSPSDRSRALPTPA